MQKITIHGFYKKNEGPKILDFALNYRLSKLKSVSLIFAFYIYRWLLQGKQPQDLCPEKWELFFLLFITFCDCCPTFLTCSECWNCASALHSSAFLCTSAILFISFSSISALIFCIFTWCKRNPSCHVVTTNYVKSRLLIHATNEEWCVTECRICLCVWIQRHKNAVKWGCYTILFRLLQGLDSRKKPIRNSELSKINTTKIWMKDQEMYPSG